MFKFLCFILNERHKNRSILAHYGSRFDNILVTEYLLLMGFTPLPLPQGQGILQLTVQEYGLTFIDSYKYYPQKLESLPKRFQLEDVKGYFPHVFNKPENWGRILKNPPPHHVTPYIRIGVASRI